MPVSKLYVEGKRDNEIYAEDLQNVRVQDPQTLCNILRDFVRDHSDEFVGFFPEFAALKHQIAGSGPEGNSDPETLSPPQPTTNN